MIGKGNRLLGAILLVSGTTIGAGMLALPVTTGLAGFLPSLLVMSAIWLYMMLTAFYFLEVNLKMKGESNLVSMMRQTLGRPGEVVAWITYLLLLYSLMAAYLLGCSQILGDFLQNSFHFTLSPILLPILVFLFFGLFVYLGTEVADFLNRLMMIGLAISYLAIIGLGLGSIDPPMLAYQNWKYVLPSLSVILTTFGYHIIIPTLTTYLEHDKKLLKRAIFIGSLVPFVVYLIWQGLVMGSVPVLGEQSLSEAAHKGLQITFFLSMIFSNPWIGLAIRLFAFFAIVTSLLGVSLSLLDFLADGLKIKKTHLKRLGLILMTFMPPLLFALFYPKGFIMALKYAGIFVAILLALFPALMAWRARKRFQQQPGEFRVLGGKVLIGFTIIISLFLIAIEVLV